MLRPNASEQRKPAPKNIAARFKAGIAGGVVCQEVAGVCRMVADALGDGNRQIGQGFFGGLGNLTAIEGFGENQSVDHLLLYFPGPREMHKPSAQVRGGSHAPSKGGGGHGLANIEVAPQVPGASVAFNSGIDVGPEMVSEGGPASSCGAEGVAFLG